MALYREKYQQTQQGQIGITLVSKHRTDLTSLLTSPDAALSPHDTQNSEWAEPIDDSDAAKAASQRQMDVILGWVSLDEVAVESKD